jgi:hypothetical protein
MDITIKNVSIVGKTEAEVAALLKQTHSMFSNCSVFFAKVEADVVNVGGTLSTEVHLALAAIRKMFGLHPNASPDAVVAALNVAATPAVVKAVAASPVAGPALAPVPVPAAIMPATGTSAATGSTPA